MKRLLSAGYPRIFQICRCFRKQERGHRHLPEFTLLEWYTAGHTYLEMMGQCEKLIQYVAGIAGQPDFHCLSGQADIAVFALGPHDGIRSL